MNPLLHIALGNALVAAILGVLVAGISRVCRRPALVHCLWVLVLVKLVTPSLVEYRIRWPDRPVPTMSKLGLASPQIPSPRVASPLRESAAGGEAFSATDVAEISLFREPPVSPAMVPLLLETNGPQSLTEQATPVPSPLFDGSDVLPACGDSIPWMAWVGGLWLVGSATWFCLIASRIYRFHRLLRCARPASQKLHDQAQRLAQRLGLKTCPSLSFVPGRVPPLVWALGRQPQLFVPSALWERLSEEQRSTLLVHELAHLRRRDHWVRGLEVIVSVLYWWHPVVWWACREIREAEEQCCDAWVVWALPRAARAYATALLATLDFLSETRDALPAVASGIGHVHDLRRRLTMIMHGTTPRALSRPGLLLVLGLGALLLPLLPTWAQGQSVEPRNQRSADEIIKQEAEEQRRIAEEDRRLAQEARAQADKAVREEEQATRAEQMREQRDRARREAEELKRQVERMKQELDRAMRRLQAAQERLAKLQDAEEGRRGEREAGRAQTKPRPTPQRPEAGDSERRFSELERRLDALLQEVQSLRREIRPYGPSRDRRPAIQGYPRPAPIATPPPPALLPTPASPVAPVVVPGAPAPPALLPRGPVPAPAPASNPDPRPVEAPSSVRS